jgi:hypothetical protein
MRQTVESMIAGAKRRIENLEPAEVAIELGDGAVLIDLREEDELRAQG